MMKQTGTNTATKYSNPARRDKGRVPACFCGSVTLGARRAVAASNAA